MKKNLLLFFFSLLAFSAIAQENDAPDNNRGTIKVQKKGKLYAVLYDEVNYRLVCKDVYGNIIDTAVVSFDLNVTVKGIAYSEQNAGSFISRPMQQRLSRMDGVIVLMFSNIKAKEKDGSIVAFPNFKAQSGYPKEESSY